ncbi:GntR family transcriptional regulator [Nonomuraea sp. NPDC050310]|uniref:GntR family transcriptional regulator n=1 Tax=Nonomuraea sp. NPDC050310 TaxID=3154935 RepID=UPI0033F60EBE
MREREIERESETPVYRQIADAIRADIAEGRYQPRRPLPSEKDLVQEFGVARDTIRRAIVHLTELGIVRTVAGRGTCVQARRPVVVSVEPGVRIVSRPASAAERATMMLAEGEWVLVVERAGADPDVLPASSSEIRVDG